MSRRAQVDVLVERAQLTRPGAKKAIRLELYQKLGTLGYVDSIEGYVADPPDGPFHDGTINRTEDIDRERYTLIRLVGHVTPYS